MYAIGDYVRIAQATEGLDPTIVGRVGRIIGTGRLGAEAVVETHLAEWGEHVSVPLYHTEITPANEEDYLMDRLTR